MNFRELPKVELHLHLDCSLSYNVVSRIDPAISLEEFRESFIAPSKCTSLADFLSRTPQGIKLMQSEANLELVVQDLFDQLAVDNVVYAEIRFAPLQHIENHLKAAEVVEIVASVTQKCIEQSQIEARLILCTLRHFSERQSLDTVKLVDKFKGSSVAGFDLAADEAGYPIDEHISAFGYAYDRKIPCTAHAGEARGPDSVWETLEHFRPQRIGHGVRSLEDMHLIEHLKKSDIHLEVCPSSNIQVDVFDLYENHVVNELYDLGVSLGINTDARTITNINLTEEYQRLHDVFGWTKEHFLKCNLNAMHASFIPEARKQVLTKQIENGYARSKP